MAENAGPTMGSASGGPEARTSSSPRVAAPLLPETGASTKSTSGRTLRRWRATPSVSATPMVPICAQTAPFAMDSTTLPPENITELTASAVGSIVMTTRASRTASTADAAACAPATARAAVAEGARSHTVVGNPAPTRLRAIAEPMMPVPSTAARTLSDRSVLIIAAFPSRA
jgi:hypothetical protein